MTVMVAPPAAGDEFFCLSSSRRGAGQQQEELWLRLTGLRFGRLWLRVPVRQSGLGGFPELLPRRRSREQRHLPHAGWGDFPLHE